MQISTYETTFKNEDQYWWSTARREIVLHLRQRYAKVANFLALNIGCGTGGLSLDLSGKTQVISLDFEQEALRFCHSKGLRKLVRADGQFLPIQSDSCDEIYALDFLEHVPNDGLGAQEIFRCLKPQTGFAIVTVPAFDFLWSKMDDIVHHQRRYRRKDFWKVLNQAGFLIELLSYYNFFLFPLGLLHKLSEKNSKKSDEETLLPSLPSAVNFTFKKIFSSEKYFLPWLSFPVGVSLIAVLRKNT